MYKYEKEIKTKRDILRDCFNITNKENIIDEKENLNFKSVEHIKR